MTERAPAQHELAHRRPHPRAVLPAPRVTPMEGFESAYRRHFSAVLRFAQSLVGRRDIAEDLTADAFVELHRHFERIVVEELPAWLFVVVRNRARDLWRRQLVEQRHAQWLAREPVETARPSAGPLWLSTDGLAPVHRVCLEMHYVGVDVAHNDTRLAIGMQADSHLVIAITRFNGLGPISPAVPLGLTLSEMAGVMRDLGCVRAVSLDGSVSAQLLLNATGTREVWPGWRKVPLGLVAEPRISTASASPVASVPSRSGLRH